MRAILTVGISLALLPCLAIAGPATQPAGDVDPSTLDGKVLCGYQGWFNTPCDGANFGFGHWAHNLGKPDGHFVTDMWPDLSEYDPADLCPGRRSEDARRFARPSV